MTYLDKLRARLKQVTDALEALSAKEELTAAEITEVEALTNEVSTIEKNIGALEAAEAARARTARPAGAPPSNGNGQVPPQARQDNLTAAEKIGFVIVAMVRANQLGLRGPAATLDALEKMGHAGLAQEFGVAQKALQSNIATAGGVLVPEDMSTDIIELLRPASTFLQGNPRVIQMPTGSYKMPAAATGATAAYRGETKPKVVTEPTFKAISLTAKLLAAIVPVSDQLIRWSPFNVRAFVENDLRQALATTMDAAALRGDGTVYTPLGITRIPGVLRTPAANTTTPTYTQVDADAAKLEMQMEGNNLPMTGIEWRMSPRVGKYLQNLRDANGNLIYPGFSAAAMMFRGYPVRFTTQIPSNLGPGTNESEIYLIAFGHVIMGESLPLQLAVSDTATVVAGPVTINAFQDNMVLIRAEMEHDFDIRYEQAVAVLTEVKWGG